ncbi:MAG: hypothetical protein BIFFINMI_02699 [Phycisphaerae bacterium]|nr:hypothetical protein [Phycisphaerae bacterium]
MAEADGAALWQRGWAALRRAAERQADHQVANEPARRFIELVTSALACGQAHLAGRDGNPPDNPEAWGWRQQTIGTGSYARNEWHSHGDRIGWLDGDDVLLDPDASYRTAQSMAGANGDALTVTARTLRKRMAEKGMVIRQTEDELLSRRVLEGRERKVLQLGKGILCTQPRDSRISGADTLPGIDNAVSRGESTREKPAETDAIPRENPPFDVASGPGFGLAVANAGNAGKGAGDALGQKVVIEL